MGKKPTRRGRQRVLVVVALVGGLTAGAGMFIGGALAARDASVDETASGDSNEPSTTSTTAIPTTTTTSTTIAPTTTTTAPAAADGVLESGEHGPEIDALQARLADLGFWMGTADGTYGQLTRQAVMAFQKAQRPEPRRRRRSGHPGCLRDGGPVDAARPRAAPTSRSTSSARSSSSSRTVRPDGCLNTSTGSGEAYAAPGGGSAVATTPRGELHDATGRSTAPRWRPLARCIARSTSTAASPSMGRVRSRPTPHPTAAPGSRTRRSTCCGRLGWPRSARPCWCTDGRARAPPPTLPSEPVAPGS